MYRCGSRVLACGETGLGPCSASGKVDLEVLHLREVEHDATICGAVTGEAVASALDGKLEPVLSRKGDDLRDV